MIFNNEEIGPRGHTYKKGDKYIKFDYLIQFILLLIIYIPILIYLVLAEKYIDATGIGILGGIFLAGFWIGWKQHSKKKHKRNR